MNADQVREHYKIVMSALKLERQKRGMFLKEPRRSKAVAEMDRAIASMQAIGDVLKAAMDAGLLTSDVEQPALLAGEKDR